MESSAQCNIDSKSIAIPKYTSINVDHVDGFSFTLLATGSIFSDVRPVGILTSCQINNDTNFRNFSNKLSYTGCYGFFSATKSCTKVSCNFLAIAFVLEINIQQISILLIIFSAYNILNFVAEQNDKSIARFEVTGGSNLNR